MTTLLIGTAIGMVAMLIIIASIKAIKKGNEEVVESQEVEVSVEDREAIIKEYSGKGVPFTISEDVHGMMSQLNVDWVEAYGTRYMDFTAALSCPHLIDEEREAMEELDGMVRVVRSEKMNAKRYLDVRDMLDGKVYIYEPCKMKLDVGILPARVAVELVRAKDLSMTIQTIYVSKTDVTATKDRYEFDMLNVDDVEAFNLLVREGQSYKEEIAELAKIEERIAHYNKLVKKERVDQVDGSIIIYPPSPEEIKEMRGEKKPVTEAQQVKEEVEEFVSSSQL